jgi:phage FluMu protein Com
MRIITLTCPDCGTIVAGNVLETHREMKCPGLHCDHVLRFSDLEQDEQNHITNNREKYVLD